MRRLSSCALLSGLGLLVPPLAWADGPPSLPADEAAPEAGPDEAPVTTDEGPADGGASGELGGEAGGEVSVDGGSALDDPFASIDAEGDGAGESDTFGDGSDASGDFGGPAESGGGVALDGEAAGAAAGGAEDPGINGPGMAQGRREPVMNTLRGPVGLYYTSLPDVGGLYTFRMRLHTDFFRKEEMFVNHPQFGPDQHSRVRGTVNMGFTFTKWTEAYFALHGAANRNERTDPARQDPTSVFALGDMDFGIKGAWRGVKGGGIGVGGQVGLGLISGTGRLLSERVNFNFDVLFAADLRYLTAKQVPVRFSTNVGWILDNSSKVTEFGDDLNSREVLRFGLGINNSRVRTRYAVDFPVRLGKEKQFGIDPIIEYNWNFATAEDSRFLALTEQAGASPLPRSQSWLTLGLRGNVWHGLFLDAAVDVGTASPNYEFGPPVPPWQMILGLGFNFDPKPVVKEVPVESGAPAMAPEPAMDDGRVIGTVLAADGTPIAGAKVLFPGLTSNAILTNENGGFVSYRFPAGIIGVTVELSDGTILETNVEVLAGQDVNVEIMSEGAAPPADGAGGEAIMDGTFKDPDGNGLRVSMKVSGQGIDESFDSNDAGRIALQLPVGDYTAVVSADGFEPKEITFTVVADEGVKIDETLSRPLPAETPNVKGSSTSIRLKKKIRFEGSDLDPKSNDILDELAAFLNAHPEYEEVEIQTHTDDRGNPKQRTEERAENVKAYLVSKGVAAGRISTRGFGDSQPKAINLTADGRRQNNRTFVRVKSYNKPGE